jgi:restriction system protein
MAVPDFQTLMLPILHLAGEGQIITRSLIEERLAEYFALNDEDRAELLPSGNQRRFTNRIAWALGYLKQAGLLATASRGNYQITDRGVAVLNSRIDRIDISYLNQFPEFQKFRTRSRNSQNGDVVSDETGSNAVSENRLTPEELIDRSHQLLRQELASNLLERIMNCSPRFFEQLVVDLLVAMGYGGSRLDAAQRVGQSGDGGIDGIINEDRLGLDVVYIQAKRWSNSVGRPVVQTFAGSLEGFRAKKGILITTSTFTQDAKEYISRIEKRIVLIDGETLAQYMIDFGVGVNRKAIYEVKKIDEDYFVED